MTRPPHAGDRDLRPSRAVSPATAARERVHLDVVIADLAERHHGVMDDEQLREAGATEKAVRHRLAVKRLHRLYPGVYAIQASPSVKGRYRAAVLACGAHAVLSHRSAADHLGLRLTSSPRLEVTVPRGMGRRPAGIVVHETRSLPPEEVTTVDGIPCTSWARTIVDNARTLGRRELDRMLERATILRAFDRAEMHAALDNAHGRRGVGTVRELLAALADESPPTRHELERRFLELVREHSLPMPVVNGQVEGHEVDFHWPAAKLIVETDGRETNDTPHAFERDHERDLDLELADWRVIRITWKQVTEEPQRIARLLSARLSEHLEDSVAA